jgi:hypothetical protein
MEELMKRLALKSAFMAAAIMTAATGIAFAAESQREFDTPSTLAPNSPPVLPPRDRDPHRDGQMLGDRAVDREDRASLAVSPQPQLNRDMAPTPLAQR